MGFLRRSLALAPRHTKEVAYKTLVRPQLEYAAPIWHPYNVAHLRSAVYTNDIENSPSIGTDEALGPFFFRTINILSIQVFPFK